MAAESLEKHGSKHGSWMDKWKKMLGIGGGGILVANYAIFMYTCGAMFPPSLLLGATAALTVSLTGNSKGHGGGRGGHH